MLLRKDFLSPNPISTQIGKAILVELMQHRRFSGPEEKCGKNPCQNCVNLHLPKINFLIESNLPITFVLPAFPGKSPNTSKVFGPLPDRAESLALLFLNDLCQKIKKIYSPGAQIILCSDGRVFSDVVGMRDEDITSYQNELSKMIVELELNSITTFNLDQLYQNCTFDQMREKLLKSHGDNLKNLQRSVSLGGKEINPTAEDKEAHRLYCGITRFLLEDANFPGQTKSKTALQKECRIRAYEVILRSKAWGDLIEKVFPRAIRLSIHPQSCGDKKIGIRLIEPDNWLTPWHGVALKVKENFILLKRREAEQLGAQLIYNNNRPDYYFLNNENELLKLFKERYEFKN